MIRAKWAFSGVVGSPILLPEHSKSLKMWRNSRSTDEGACVCDHNSNREGAPLFDKPYQSGKTAGKRGNSKGYRASLVRAT